MEDANFSREGFVISKNIKGNIGSFEIKMPGLGNYFIKIGATTTKRILDQYYSDIANAAGWSGIGIVEGTALYLESIKQEAAGQSLLNAFNMSESAQIEESVVTEASLSGIEFGNDDDIHPTKFKPLAISLKKNKVKMEVEKEEGDHGYPEVKLTGKRKDIEKVLADRVVGDIAIGLMESLGLTESHPKCSNKKGHAYKEIDKDGTVECEYCGLRNSLSESVVTEAEVNSDEEFTEYANTVLKQAFGEEFDEAKAKKVIDGILAKADGDYGTAAGMLTSSLGA